MSLEESIDQHPQQIFERFDAYNFAKDEEYQDGLEEILKSNPKVDKDMLLMAKIFFYSKKVEPIDYYAYKAFKEPVPALTDDDVDLALAVQSRTQSQVFGTQVQPEVISAPPFSDTEKTDAPYPATFAEIVELISSGKPIPGIKEIPDQLAHGTPSATATQLPKKPWETEGQTLPSILD